jgi:hypothetical protein
MSQLLAQVLQANIYLQPVQFTLTVTTNILNLCVLSSRALRSSPCTHYFLAYAVLSIMYNSLVCPTQFLRGFDLDWANTPVGCKIHFYILFLLPFTARIMLVLASFDRYRSSSKSLRFHSRSTISIVRTIIIISSILCAIYMSPMLTIYYFNETTGVCTIYSNRLGNIYVFSQIIIYYISTPILMIVFGILTIYNIHQTAGRTEFQAMRTRGRRTEGQLARMLILQVSVHLVLTTLFGVTYTMNALIPSTRTPDILAIRYILVIWQQSDYFLSFFLYIFSGKVYRKQLLRILKFIKRPNLKIHPVMNHQQVTIRNLCIFANNVLLMHGNQETQV